MNQKTPQIRFKTFSNQWKEYKLEEYAKYRRGSFPQPYGKKEWYDGKDSMPFVQVVDVTENMLLSNPTKQKISKLAQPMSVFVSKGTIVVTLQGSIGRVAITQFDAYVDRTILIFEDYKEKIDYNFFAYVIQNKFNTEKKKAPGGTIKTITKEALSEFILNIPEYKEQTKIGNLLNVLDNMITLYQNKINKLINIKNTLLSKMFPTNGKNIPEIRFKNFTKEWEKCKIEEIFDYERPEKYIVHSEEYNDNFNIPVLTANKAFILGYTNETNTYNKESIIFDDFTLESKFVDFPYMVKSSAIKILTLKNKKTNNLKFNYELLNNIKLESLGHARHYISVIQPKEVYTTQKEEQEKISKLFENIDDLANLYEMKLEKIRNIKTALLEKMFI